MNTPRHIHPRDPARTRLRRGAIVLPVLIILLTIATVLGLFFLLTEKTKHRKECEENLTKIYRALEQYENDRGVLPNLAYFPSDPQTDSDSLPVALESYGADARAAICPAMHPLLAEHGLTYVWNITLGGKRMPRAGPPVWMLVEMTAINPDLPPPHAGAYNVLFTDGTIKRLTNPLKDLKGL